MRSRFGVGVVVAAFAVLAVVFIPAAVGSPAGAAQAIAHLNLRTHSMYGTLDPGYTQNCYSPYCSLIYERLLRVDDDGKLLPGLAVSYRNPVPDTYDFTLRRGVRFWDGAEMTADDVVNSLNYERYPKFNSAIALHNVKNVRALGRYKVRLSLKHADASFAAQLAIFGSIFEKKFQQQAGADFGKPGTLTMATGPFRPTSFDGKSKLELAANPRWWGGKVNIQRVTVSLIADDTAAALAIRSGQIDAGAGYGDPRAMASALGSGGTVYRVTWGTSHKWFSLNTRKAPFDDVHVRRAMSYATNRTELVAAGGGGTPLFTMITPVQLLSVASAAQVNALMKTLNLYPFSLAKARQELAQSKVPNGFSTSINCPPFGVQECQVWAGQMAKIGIKIQVNAVDVLKYVNEVYGATKDFSFIYGYIPGNTDPNSLLSFSLGSSQLSQLNAAQWAPADVDRLLNEGVATLNKAKRFAVYSQILKRLSQDAPYVPYALPVYSIMLSDKYTYPGISKLRNEIAFSEPWILKLRPK